MHPMTRRRLLALGCLAAAAANGPLLRPARAAGSGDPAPELAGLENWINSDPLTIAGLRGRVVLVDFWTYGCANCVNTLPSMVRWHDELAPKGLTILGVHTPEFPFERELSGLQRAIAQHGIRYPVAQDNGYRTWRAYETRYWPTSVLVDRSGRIVTYHEGDQGLDALGAEIRKQVEG